MFLDLIVPSKKGYKESFSVGISYNYYCRGFYFTKDGIWVRATNNTGKNAGASSEYIDVGYNSFSSIEIKTRKPCSVKGVWSVGTKSAMNEFSIENASAGETLATISSQSEQMLVEVAIIVV